MELIDPYIVLGVGVGLVALEIIFPSFIVIWFGIGAICVGLISLVYDFPSGLWQIAISSVIAFLLFISFRKKAVGRFLDTKEHVTDNFLQKGGIGEIKHGKVFFKGTYWDIDLRVDASQFKEGQKVEVLKTYKNIAQIKNVH